MTYPAFSELLAPTFKAAQAAPPSEQQFEADFANLASAVLRDRAGPLLPHVLGFETVERAPDNSKGVGIFAAKLGEDFYYVPVFYRDGQVVGMDSVYSKKTNTFMPITDTTLARIVNKTQVSIGRKADVGSGIMRGFENPQLGRLMTGPQQSTGKYAGAGDPGDFARTVWADIKAAAAGPYTDDQALIVGQVIAHLDGTPVSAAAAGSTLCGLLTELGSQKLANAVTALLVSHPRLAERVLPMYDDSLEDIVAVIADAEPKQAGQAKAGAAIEFVGVDDVPCCAPERERRRLVRTGFAVIDNRQASHCGSILPAEAETVFTNPTSPGVYKVVLASGAVKEYPVLTDHRLIGDSCELLSTLVLSDDTPARAFCADGSVVHVLGTDDGGGLEKVLKYGVPVSRMIPDKSYLIVDRTGRSVGPLHVRSMGRSGDRKILAECSHDHVRRYASSVRSGTFASPRAYTDYAGADWRDTGAISVSLITRTGDLVIETVGSGIRISVPSDCKIIEVERWNRPAAGFAPSAASMLTANMLKCAHPVMLRYDRVGRTYDVWLSDRRSASLSEKQAMVRLLVDGRLRAEDADQLLGMAASAPGSTKTAQIAFPEDDPSSGQYNMPLIDRTIQAQDAGTQELTGRVMNNAVQLPSSTPGLDQSILGQPQDADISELMALAEQARASGQRTVLDHAMIGSLARVHDVGSVIDSMLPKFRTTLDAMGRLLYLFHWKPEEWAERYGDDKRMETQDQLTSLYKGLGDISTRLEETRIEGDPALA